MRTLSIALFILLFAIGMTYADLNGVIEDINLSARADMGGYKAKMEARFGTSGSQIDVVLRSVECPVDAAIV